MLFFLVKVICMKAMHVCVCVIFFSFLINWCWLFHCCIIYITILFESVSMSKSINNNQAIVEEEVQGVRAPVPEDP